MIITGYAGSYATSESQHVIRFLYDEMKERFVEAEAFLPWADAKYLSYQASWLSAVIKQDQAGIVLRNLMDGTEEVVWNEQNTSCYIEQDARCVYTANYHEGTLSIYHKQPTLTLYKRILIKEKAGCHQVLLFDRYVLVPCLLLDALYIFDSSLDYACVKIVPFPKGSGPRHGVIDQKNRLFLVSEYSNQLFTYQLNSLDTIHVERLTCTALHTTDTPCAAAAIRIDPQQRFLYVSLRECNEIVVYDIESQRIQQRIPSNGIHPRDIRLSPSGTHLFVIHRFSNELCVFRCDQASGRLTPLQDRIPVVEGVSVILTNDSLIHT